MAFFWYETNTSQILGVKKMAKDIVDVAIGELGYRETGSNSTKYGKWYGMNGAAWCHMFVSWCADQAGISTSVVPKTASTTIHAQKG